MEGKQELEKIGNHLPKSGNRRLGIDFVNGRPRCQRCGTWIPNDCQLEVGGYFCPGCLFLGRITQEDELVCSYEPMAISPQKVTCTWSGQLTAKQQIVADELTTCLTHKQNALLWAVTGSGKTEMLFPFITQALSQGLQVCFATPRIDVCNEIFPRLKQAFGKTEILLRHSQGEEWHSFQLLVATTHQLLHFYQAFDVLIIDESDAFPYEGDPVLSFGSQQALKQTGCLVHVTATPSKELLRRCQQENWKVLTLFQRYHKRPLVVPELYFLEDWPLLPQRKRKLKKLARLCLELLKDNQVLLFCPEIPYLKDLERALKVSLPQLKIASVFAEDKKREEKIKRMRQGKWDILLTSTVLERGVTFASVSVIVLGAEHQVFKKSTLIQIAGRVDRVGSYQKARVIFCFQEMTYAMRQAIQEIKVLNQQGGKTNDL